jgi:hypothetical protein
MPAGSKARFVGKHSKDQRLALYLQKRVVYEQDDGVEPLVCLLRVAGDASATVVVGVAGRILLDGGLHCN